MKFLYQKMVIYYESYGMGQPIILLHGWGTSHETFKALIEQLKGQYLVYAIDLPGFGISDEPKQALSLDDYVDFLEHFILEMRLKCPYILGHSFGGRIAIKYASSNKPLKGLILISSAGIKRFSLLTTMRIIWFKTKKLFYKLCKNERKLIEIYQKHGSSDYKNVSMNMKATMSKVIAENLTGLLRKIKAPTLIIWGKCDQTTPYKDALKMQRLIKNSGLVGIEDAGHFAYLEQSHYVSTIIKTFMESDQ